jgi:methionyl-tRNA formyltransferase
LVRGFNPWPVAETRLHDQQLKIWQATPVAITAAAVPGTVLSAGPAGLMIATGHHVLNVTRVQLAGRKPVSAGDFANAHSLVGAVLSSKS